MNNSFAIFEDTVGKDEWVGPHDVMVGQNNVYHAGGSLSIASASAQMQQKGRTFLPFEMRDQRTVVFRLGKSLEALADDASIAALIAQLYPAQ